MFNEGRFYENYEKFGAHPGQLDGRSGVWFAVWAPNAAAVSVIGDFNAWRREAHPLRCLASSGVWEGFIEGLEPGAIYKYFIRSRENGYDVEKADPFAFGAEMRPRTASRVCNLETYRWQDARWMESRGTRNNREAPLSIYEVHAGSWMRVPEDGGRPLSYRELAPKLAAYARKMGFTHVELLPVTEHPFDGSWGYQTVGYFAATSRFGAPQDFMFFVDTLHRAGIGVILDWAPAHFPNDEHGPAYFDGTHLYEHADPRRRTHPHWGSLIFNYGRNEVTNFLIGSALFWFDKYHIDGLRIDAVASHALSGLRPRRRGLGPERLRREREPGGGRLPAAAQRRGLRAVPERDDSGRGIDFLARRLAACLRRGARLRIQMEHGLDARHAALHDLRPRASAALSRLFDLQHALRLSGELLAALFPRRGRSRKRLDAAENARRRLAEVCQSTPALRLHVRPSGKKLLFMGCEFGQRGEWNHDGSLDWSLTRCAAHKGLQKLTADLNRLYCSEPALFRSDCDPGGFEWIDCADRSGVIGFIRKSGGSDPPIVVVCNFMPVPRYDYRIGAPAAGRWDELLNSDSAAYGGSEVGNLGGVEAEEIPCHGRGQSLRLVLPPLAALFLKPAGCRERLD